KRSVVRHHPAPSVVRVGHPAGARRRCRWPLTGPSRAGNPAGTVEPLPRCRPGEVALPRRRRLTRPRRRPHRGQARTTTVVGGPVQGLAAAALMTGGTESTPLVTAQASLGGPARRGDRPGAGAGPNASGGPSRSPGRRGTGTSGTRSQWLLIS